MSSSSSSAIELLKDISVSGTILIGGCHELGKSLPTMHSSTDWPIILGHFKNIAKQIEEIGSKAESQLAHSVAVPMDPGRTEDNRPTMKVPELLRTKLPPEQEAQLAKMTEQVKADTKTPAIEQYKEHKQNLGMYNTAIDNLIESFVEDDGKLQSLKRKLMDTVTQSSAKRTNIRHAEGIDMFTYYVSGGSTTPKFHVRSSKNT